MQVAAAGKVIEQRPEAGTVAVGNLFRGNGGQNGQCRSVLQQLRADGTDLLASAGGAAEFPRNDLPDGGSEAPVRRQMSSRGDVAMAGSF